MSETGFWLTIAFDEPVIFSASSATAGGHETLDHVPGSALLGAVAARHYRGSGEDAYEIFHSGAVRFGNGYPVTQDGRVSIPAPLSLFYCKAEPKEKRAAKGYRQFVNLVDPANGRGLGQLEQLRRTFVAGADSLISVNSHSSLRTAIDDELGIASRQQLFPYAALPAGLLFAAWIGFAEGSERHIDMVRASLDGQLYLGRSRSAEHGKCRSSCSPTTTVAQTGTSRRSDGATSVYCSSDIALVDEYGMAVREPLPHHFGLAAGTIDWSCSHIRNRSYSPFNAALRTYEPARAVIEKGSVLVFRDTEPAGFSHGICGLHAAQGLGRFLVDPPFLLGNTLLEWEPARIALPSERKADANDHADPQLAALLVRRRSGRQTGVEWAAKFHDPLRELYLTARELAGAGDHVAVGPSPSQWGRLRSIALRSQNAEEFRKDVAAQKIFRRHREKGEEKLDAAWGATGRLDERFVTFEEWFLAILESSGGSSRPRGMDDVRALLGMAAMVAAASASLRDLEGHRL